MKRAATISAEQKKLIEKNPLAFATVGSDGKPNVIGVAFVQVVSPRQILISDNYMTQTRENLKKNPAVCIAVWDRQWHGCKIVGTAKYHDTGKWLHVVKALRENKGLPAKGAVLVKVGKILPLQ